MSVPLRLDPTCWWLPWQSGAFLWLWQTAQIIEHPGKKRAAHPPITLKVTWHAGKGGYVDRRIAKQHKKLKLEVPGDLQHEVLVDSINSDDDISEAATIHEETMSPASIFDSPGCLTIHEPSELEEQPTQEKDREELLALQHDARKQKAKKTLESWIIRK